MSEIPKINIPNIAIPTFRTNEVWLNGVPFVPSNDPVSYTHLTLPTTDRV